MFLPFVKSEATLLSGVACLCCRMLRLLLLLTLTVISHLTSLGVAGMMSANADIDLTSKQP